MFRLLAFIFACCFVGPHVAIAATSNVDVYGSTSFGAGTSSGDPSAAVRPIGSAEMDRSPLIRRAVVDYFGVRPDLRKCMSPLCGGYFVRALNSRTTRCADGSVRTECYVTGISWGPSGLPNDQTSQFGDLNGWLLKGAIRPVSLSGFSGLGEFVAREAWQPATGKPASGTFVRLTNSGIVCITTPCPSIRQQVLNSRLAQNISAVDLSAVGATDEQIEAAYANIDSEDGVLAAGMNAISTAGPRPAISFTATQFYFKLRPPVGTGLNLVGSVVLSPTCPGPVSPGQICEKPYAGATVQVLAKAQTVQANAKTDGSGKFGVRVAPGEYVVRVLNLLLAGLPDPSPLPTLPSDPATIVIQPAARALPFPACPDTPVTVPIDGVTSVKIDCDTGIR